MLFRLNDRGVDDLIRRGVGVRGYLEQVAAQAVSEVESQGSRFARTGRFADSIEKTGVEADRRGASITVHSTDFAAHIVEFGSRNNPPYAPFRKAAAALGLRLKGGGERK